MPKHIYEGSDPLKNPANLAPIGTGPFKFKEWQRGSHIMLVRNDEYWDKPKPYLDALIFRIIPDGSARAVALESGAVQYGTQYIVPSSVQRKLRPNPRHDGRLRYNTSSIHEFNRAGLISGPACAPAISHATNTDFW